MTSQAGDWVTGLPSARVIWYAPDVTERTDDDPTRFCPVCGATQEEHRQLQAAANEMREYLGLPPLDPPDIETGFQRR